MYTNFTYIYHFSNIPFLFKTKNTRKIHGNTKFINKSMIENCFKNKGLRTKKMSFESQKRLGFNYFSISKKM